VYKLPIYEYSRRIIGKKKSALDKYLRIPTVQILFRYHVLLLRYFVGTEKSAFQANVAKNWAVFFYNFAKKLKFPKKYTGEKRSTT